MSRGRVALAAAAVVLTLGAGLTGCSSPADPPKLSVEHPYIPLPAADDMAAGYLTVRNEGGIADRLIKVTSDITDDLTMHRTSGTAMEEVSSFDVPANGELTFGRGGNHLMFMGLSVKPRIGQKVGVTLEFAESGPMKVEMPVKELAYRPPTGSRHK